MSSKPKITAIAPWFGSKRTLAPRIVAELGKHSAYWEPFCGSMAVLLDKPKCNSETVNDLNSDITNLAKVIAGEGWGYLQERLGRTLFSQGLFEDTKSKNKAKNWNDSYDRAYCFFVESWMGKNGIAGTRTANTHFSIRYTTNGGDPATRFLSAVDSIKHWHERMAKVWILEEDGLALCERIEDKKGTVIYCDPPYLVKGSKYIHDFEDNDHQRLATALAKYTMTRVVVSYYEHHRLAELYPGWTKVECPTAKSLTNPNKRDEKVSVKAPEVLLINGESYTGELFQGMES